MIAILKGTEVIAEVGERISLWATRLYFNQEGIMRDWLTFARPVKGGRVSQAERAP